MKRDARVWLAACALALAAPALGDEPKSAAAERTLAETPLAGLVGAWKMTGHVAGQPVAYAARGEWALGGTFLRFAMTDVAVPPGYQAEVFLGWDGVSERFVAHWLDAFGARPSETLGFGVFEGDSLTLVFEYPSGPFRTTFAREASGGWRVTMRAKEGRAPWETFAEYALTRAAAP